MSATSTIRIFQADGVLLVEPLLTANAKHEQELMKSDFISLEWKDSEYTVLPMGAYIVYNGLHYTLFDAYKPENSNGVYVYKPQFEAPQMILAHTPCLFSTNNAHSEPIKQVDWVYTGNLQTIVGRIVIIVGQELDKHLEAVIKIKSTTSLPASATCTFSGVDIMSALNEICSQFGGLDWHVDWEGGLLYIGDITAGGDEYVIDPETGKLVPRQDGGTEPVALAEGGNVQFASVNRNGEAFANYFIVRGGTRNIAVQTQSNNNVQTDTRLELDPTLYPDSVIDNRTDTENEPKVQKILIFDDVYPHLNLYAYNIRKRTRILTDKKTGAYIPKTYDQYGNVTEYKTYSIYYMRLAYPTNEAMTTWNDYLIQNPKTDIMNGRKRTCSFEPNEEGTHSELAGREFELSYHETNYSYPSINSKVPNTLPVKEDSGVQILPGDYEIIYMEDNEMIIPNDDTLEPWGEAQPSKECDIVVLFNIVMSSDYIAQAQRDLATAAQNEIARILTDDNNYTVKSNPVAFNTNNPNLQIGSNVDLTLQNGVVMNTRVIKLVTNIDYPCQQEITIGNAVIKGSTQSLKEDVKTLSAAIDINESSATTINKMISQLYRLLREYENTYLHKDRADATPFELGVKSLISEAQASIGGDLTVGSGLIPALKVFSSMLATELGGVLQTNHFKRQMSSGLGWGVDYAGNMQVESLEVRSALRVLELVFNRLSAEESEYVFTESGTITTIEYLGEIDGRKWYRCTLDKRNETDFHAFRKGDVIRGIYNDLANLGGGQYFTSWMDVEYLDLTANTITVSAYEDERVPAQRNYAPEVHMVIQRWGNRVTPSAASHADEDYRSFIEQKDGVWVNRRQSCWYISSIEKRIAMLDHVNQPILSDGNYAAFFGLPYNLSTFKGHPMNESQPYLYVRGAFLQDIFYIDYLGNIMKAERFRGNWNADTAAGSDPYVVTETTFDTVYHDQAKWKCMVSRAVNPPSHTNPEWELLQSAVDATFYRLVPSQSSIRRDTDGYPYVTQLNVTVEKIEGKNVTVLTDEDVYCIINGVEIRHQSSIELGKDDGIESVDFFLMPSDGDKYDEARFDEATFAVPLATVTVPIISDGKKGADGDGRDGVGIQSLTEEYAVSQDINTLPESNAWTTLNYAKGQWDADMPVLWNRETVTYTRDKAADVKTHIVAIWAEDGRSLTNIINWYKTSNNTIEVAGGTQQGGQRDTPIGLTFNDANPYLWNYEQLVFSDNTTQNTTPGIKSIFSRGARGAILRGPSVWKPGVEYQGGNGSDEYQDIVTVTSEGVTHFYLCHFTHTSNAQNEPSQHSHNNAPWDGNEPWQMSQVSDFVATKVLFAERGKIENADIKNVTIRGTITEDCKVFNKICVDNPSGYETLDYDVEDPANLVEIVGSEIEGKQDSLYSVSSELALIPGSEYYEWPDDVRRINNQIVQLPTYDKKSIEGVDFHSNPYKLAGTRLSVFTTLNPDINWVGHNFYDNNNSYTELINLYNQSVLVCADPEALLGELYNINNGTPELPKEWRVQAKHPWNALDITKGIHGRFCFKGRIARFVLLLPGQHLDLISQIQYMPEYDSEEATYIAKPTLVWNINNASDFDIIDIEVNANNTDLGNDIIMGDGHYWESPRVYHSGAGWTGGNEAFICNKLICKKNEGGTETDVNVPIQLNITLAGVFETDESIVPIDTKDYPSWNISRYVNNNNS